MVQEFTISQDDLEREQDEILAAMQEMIESAPEPGTVKIRDVIHRGDEAFPSPIVVQALRSAGYCFIYDTRTAEQSLTNRNMLPTQLAKRREDGSKVFTTKEPKFEPKRGTFKCMLHADDENRTLYDSWGLPACRKSNLTSKHQVELHMQHRHSTEWKTIERERERQEKEHEDARQERMIQALVARADGISQEKQKKG